MAHFRLNPSFARLMVAEAEMKAGLRAIGEDVKGHAENFMPRGPDPRHGHMADKFRVVEEDGEIRVGNTDEAFFHLAEFGSLKNPPYAPLRRAAQAAGLELREDRG
jgi:hypothetical protein